MHNSRTGLFVGPRVLCLLRFVFQEVFVKQLGKTAISSHISSKKHQAATKLLQSGSQTNVLSFFTTNVASSPSTSTNVSFRMGTDATSAPVTLPVVAPTGKSSTVGTGFVLKDDVTKAEIMWCLNVIMTQGSFRSAAASAALFPLMFPASEIARKMQLGKDKVGYTVCHGLAPYFREKLLSILAGVSYLVVSFDESLNKVSQKEQLDVMVRYWAPTDATVRTQYLTSCFLGHICAEDLASAFRKATEDVKKAKILQVSMDGLNVNIKFLRSLKEERTARL
ncbi:uncharacterized protein LOC120840620 [Ixodes scapularis]|uniref:uncharacterized protein LOC120840620 n=1 Tax=Ixodes scapularis TaxID=6945 RepID=UPI001A9FC285|nr:uncharacterized protein LOC120840620 [Ixodes scapularis]